MLRAFVVRREQNILCANKFFPREALIITAKRMNFIWQISCILAFALAEPCICNTCISVKEMIRQNNGIWGKKSGSIEIDITKEKRALPNVGKTCP